MTLHPQAVAALALWAAGPSVTDPGFGPEGIESMRREAHAAAAREVTEEVGSLVQVDADGVPCRLHVPDSATEQPRRVLVYLHGGGFVFGDLETHDGQARRLADRTRSAVLAVDYRRPPEHRFPAAPDDVDTVLRWLVAHAGELGLDPRRVVTVGDSAGGNLALVAALRNPGLLAATVLVYPFLDPSVSMPSYARPDGGLTRGEAAWYWAQYAADERDTVDPDLAPMDSPALDTVPPTLVQVAGCDVLADEDLVLAARLADAGVDVTVTTYDGMVHGFWRHPALFDAAETSLLEIATFVGRFA